MPFRLYKNIFFIFALLTLLSATTYAYFTSTVKAQDNEITTGTLLAGIASVDAENSSYLVSVDNNGILTGLGRFSPMTSLLPGDNREIYLAVFNKGTVPFNYRGQLVGHWLTTPRIIPPLEANPALVNIQTVNRIGENDTSDPKVESLNNFLLSEGYQWQTGASADTLTPDPISGYINDNQTLSPNHFQIYRLDLNLSDETGNDYQGATYTYDYLVDAKQITAPTF